jgi:hypothetical protein
MVNDLPYFMTNTINCIVCTIVSLVLKTLSLCLTN